jgi:uncharacterized protein YjbI with pentapeptide repeats
MEDYKTIENKTIESAHSDRKAIYKKCSIDNFILEENSDLEECIFIGCHIHTMQILKIKKPRKITFINCRIKDLKINRSNLPNIQFIGCEIIDSAFTYSNLLGITFALELQEKPDYIKQNIWRVIIRFVKELISSNKKPTEESSVFRSKFLFCDMNDMHIDHTSFSCTELKHCNIEDMKIIENVTMKKVDFRGSNFFKTDFGECRFGVVKYNRSKYPVEVINVLLNFILNLAIKRKYAKYVKQKEDLSRIIFEKTTKIRTWMKKLMYKLRMSTFADWLCSTTLDNVKYRDTYFTQDIRFFWHMEDSEFVENLKKKHKYFSFIMLITSNYLRSFFMPFFFIVLVIFLFSGLYSTYGVFAIDGSTPIQNSPLLDSDGHPIDSWYLSGKIFLNCGISPLRANDTRTKWLIILEVILGYFFLGTLLGVVANNFLIKPMMPKKWMPDSGKTRK